MGFAANRGRALDAGDVDAKAERVSWELEHGEESFCQTLASLPVPVALLRQSDHHILYTNPSLDKLYGVAPGKLHNRDWTRLFPRLADRRLLTQLASTREGVHGVVVQGRRDDGQALYLSVWQQRVVCYQRECLLMVLIDVTAQKNAERIQTQREQTLRTLLELSDRNRELIAYEIHDGFLQDMVTTIMHLDACHRLIRKDSQRALEEVDKARKTLRQGVKEARRLIDGVRMPDLTSAGLIGAVQVLLQRVSAYSNVDVEFVPDMAFPRLSPECEVAIYRIVQEGLNNVCRHSQSDKARVELKADENCVQVVIRDWGVGFDPKRVGEGHFGLVGMRYRASLFEGDVNIDSAPKRGTTITVTLPLRQDSVRGQAGHR